MDAQEVFVSKSTRIRKGTGKGTAPSRSRLAKSGESSWFRVKKAGEILFLMVEVAKRNFEAAATRRRNVAEAWAWLAGVDRPTAEMQRRVDEELRKSEESEGEKAK
jgi:hypothetical protein